MNIFGIGPLEILLILSLALIVFGPERLPEMARQAGKFYGELRRLSNEVTGELQRGLQIDERTRPRPALRPPVPPPPAAKPFAAKPPVSPANAVVGQADPVDIEPPY